MNTTMKHSEEFKELGLEKKNEIATRLDFSCDDLSYDERVKDEIKYLEQKYSWRYLLDDDAQAALEHDPLYNQKFQAVLDFFIQNESNAIHKFWTIIPHVVGCFVVDIINKYNEFLDECRDLERAIEEDFGLIDVCLDVDRILDSMIDRCIYQLNKCIL